MLIMSYMGDHVWLITSKQTEPDLSCVSPRASVSSLVPRICCSLFLFVLDLASSFLINCRSSVDLQLVYVRVENPICEADARRLVWVLVRQFDVDLPDATFERCCFMSWPL